MKLANGEHIGDTILTRRNTVETVMSIYPDGRENEPREEPEPLF